MRELARAEATPITGTTTLEAAVADLRSGFGALRIETEGLVSVLLGMSPESIGVVLSHVADNAQRHGATTLTIASARDGDDWKLVIRDDGRGVSLANRARIFDSFFTTRREDGGTGMGLAIVRAMLEAHGGRIDLIEDDDANPPFGAAFALIVPLAQF